VPSGPFGIASCNRRRAPPWAITTAASLSDIISVETFGLHANQIEHFSTDSDPEIHQAAIEETQTTEGISAG
jgi:hypothetical protein